MLTFMELIPICRGKKKRKQEQNHLHKLSQRNGWCITSVLLGSTDSIVRYCKYSVLEYRNIEEESILTYHNSHHTDLTVANNH